MSTEYVKTNWQDGDIITADKMNNIENGIERLDADTSQLKEDYTTILDSAYVTDTASGSIASFPDGADDISVKSLKVNIEPVQDLHGQESPWPAGGGKNIFNPVTWLALGSNTKYYTVSSDETITIIANDTSGIADRMFDVDPGESYSMLSTGFSDVKIFNSSLDSILSRVSGTFTAPADGKIAVKFYASSYPTSGKFIIVKGGTVPSSWSPYENICPISGHTQAVVTRTGKNLLAKPFAYYSDVPATLSNCFFIKAGQYIFHFDSISATSWRFCFRLMDKNGNFLSDIGHRPVEGLFYNNTVNGWLNGADITLKQLPFTIVEDCFIRIVFSTGDTSSSTTVTGAQLELGSTATAYEPYQGQTVTIDLNGTIYGGTLDVGTGVLTVDKAIWDFNASVNAGGYGMPFSAFLPNNVKMTTSSTVLSGTICNQLMEVTQVSSWGINGTFARTANSTRMYFKINDDVTTIESLNEYLALHPLQFAYPIANPFNVQLTANEISTLLGQNNIWSDAGTVDVEYRADTKLYIEKLTAPTEDDMVADANIVSGQYFMVGNTLYKATANIASGGAITPNVNCIRKSLPEALNEINA